MLGDEIEFCKECGMEFPYGVEEICPLCENEVEGVDENEAEVPPLVVAGDSFFDADKCEVCKKWCSETDLWFSDFWAEFASPDWLSIEDMWCVDCIIKNFRSDHPDFAASGLEPDTYLVWQDALDSGIDLGPKLFDIEMSNAIRRLHDCAVSREDIIQWLDSDIHIDEAEQWPNLLEDFDEAMAWRNAGFFPNEETGNWLKWECSPETALGFIQQGVEWCPSELYRKLDVSLHDAVFYESNGFTDSTDDGGQYFIGTWLSSGLTPTQIVKLRNELLDNDSAFAILHNSSRRRIEDRNLHFFFWDYLPNMFEALNTIGLRITAENLERFWGLNSNDILRAIDMGGDIENATSLVRVGGPSRKLPLVKRLTDKGVLPEVASSLTKRGFLLKHLKEIEKSGGSVYQLSRLNDILNTATTMKVDEAIKWLESDGWASDVLKWKAVGFDVDIAIRWIREGFSPALAKQWHESGVRSPTAAKRRSEAGINP